MKRLLLILLLCASICGLHGQNAKFNAELNYPLPVGNNFIQRNYYGIVDAGLGYKFFKPAVVSLGVSLHGSVFKINNIDDLGVNGVPVNSYWIKPRVFAELDSEILGKFRPSLGIGYSFLIFDVIEETTENQDSNESGFNLNIGIAYDFSRRLYLKFQYDFIKLGLDDDIPDVSYNNSVHVLYLGLGLRF